jgi:hypothetical protein
MKCPGAAKAIKEMKRKCAVWINVVDPPTNYKGIFNMLIKGESDVICNKIKKLLKNMDGYLVFCTVGCII